MENEKSLNVNTMKRVVIYDILSMNRYVLDTCGRRSYE